MQAFRISGRYLKGGLYTVALFMSLVLVVSACGGEVGGDLAVGDKAPEFSLKSFGGETIQLSDYQGNQPVLLYFHMAVG